MPKIMKADRVINSEALNAEMIINEAIRKSDEATRKADETVRQAQEGMRQTNTSTAIANSNTATTRANLAAKSCEDIASGILEMPDIGTPDTYTKVTTDVKGRVVSGSSPTAIADLGITNVYTKTEIDTNTNAKLDKTSVINNLVTTVEGTVLDGRQGKALSDKIGNVSDLTTASKTDLVGAVNEVNNNLGAGLKIETGFVVASDVPPNAQSQPVIISFTKKFTKSPAVFCNCSGWAGDLFANGDLPTTAGVNIYVRNVSGVAKSTTIQWLAIGI